MLMLLFALSENPLGGFDCRRAPPKKSLNVRTTRDGNLWKVCSWVSKQSRGASRRSLLWTAGSSGVVRLTMTLLSGSPKEISGVLWGVTAGTQNCHALSTLVDVHVSNNVLFLLWVIQLRALHPKKSGPSALIWWCEFGSILNIKSSLKWSLWRVKTSVVLLGQKNICELL